MRADAVAAEALREQAAGTIAADVPAARAALRLVLRRPAARVALGTLVLLVLVALLAPWISPHAPHAMLDPVALKLRAPSAATPFGTDQYSRDLLSRMLWGARVSLAVAATSVTLATLVGTLVGVVAGFAGGTTDAVLMRLVDALLAIPRVLLLVAVVGLWGKLGVVPLVLLLGLTGWMGVARLVRAQARAVAAREHVLAARALGASRARMLVHHVLPACVTPALVAATLGVPAVISLEAGLSYLGLGVQPPHASWGNLIRDGSDYLASAPWISVIPGIAIVVVMLACTALGDALRDALDPRELSRR